MSIAGSLVGSISGGWHTPDIVAIGLTLGACALIGLANAFTVVVLGINAFIATLAMATIISGLTLYVSKGGIVTTVPDGLTYFGETRIPVLQIEPVAFVGFGLAIVLWYVYEHTPLGRRLYFVGEGREAARLTGLPVNVLRGSTFVGAAVISGAAGCFLAGEFGWQLPVNWANLPSSCLRGCVHRCNNNSPWSVQCIRNARGTLCARRGSDRAGIARCPIVGRTDIRRGRLSSLRSLSLVQYPLISFRTDVQHEKELLDG